jgi:molecular chaperone GrpE
MSRQKQPHEYLETPEASAAEQGVTDSPDGETDGAEDDFLSDELIDFSAADLARQLEQANSKAQEHWDKLMRAKAEMDNLRKRHERELEGAYKYGLERFANALLQVRDSLELGQQAALDPQTDIARLREGTALTLKLMADVMEKFGIEQLDPQGKPFNPEFHQAMALQPVEGKESNSVVQVVQKGYRLNGIA